MRKADLLSVTSLGLVALAVVLLNVIGGRALRGARLDLTDKQLYTLAEGSRNIVAALDEPISLRLYVSENLATDAPGLEIYADRIRELLEEFAGASRGKVTLRVIDPEPFSEAEDEAVSAGLQGLPANAAGDLIYLGLVGTNSIDDREVIPFFHPSKEAFLEYEVSRLLSLLANREPPVVGLLSSLPLRGGPPPIFPGQAPPPTGWMIADQIEGLFEVRDVEPGAAAIDDDVDVLMVVHPRDLPEATERAIDDFALRGGKLLVFVDPHAEEEVVPSDPSNPMAAMMAERSSDMERLFRAWGLQLRPALVVADRQHALQVTTGSQARPEAVDFVTWLGFGADALDPEDPVSSGLALVRMPSAGSLERLPESTVEFRPLIQTGADACEVPVAKVQFMPDPKRLLAEYEPGGRPLVVAARLSGTVTSAFPEPAPAADGSTEDEDEGEADGATGEPDAADEPRAATPPRSGRLDAIVVADADLLADRWWVRVSNLFGMRMAMPTADNADFVVNALENLSGSSDLISIRSRGSSERPFELVADLRRQADARFLAKEQELQARLRETEQRLSELQQQREDGTSMLLTPEQRDELARFQEQRVVTRKALRDVRHQLEQDIERLQTWLKLANVLLAPLLIVGLLVLLAGSLQRRSARPAP